MNEKDVVGYISDGVERAKIGDAITVYDSIIANGYDTIMPVKSHYAFGWIIYYALHQSAKWAIKERKLMLAHYLRLNVPRPHKLHSMILTEALSLYRDCADIACSKFVPDFNHVTDGMRFSIIKFMDLWGLDNLRDGDWKRKLYEGKYLPSTVKKLINRYSDELYSGRLIAGECFRALLSRALSEYGRSASVYAEGSKVYEVAGEKEKAINLLKKAIALSPKKFYYWSRLAGMLDGKDTLRLRVSLLWKALSCPGREEIKGRVHLSLAKCLAEGGAFAQAQWELKEVKKLYESHEWFLPREYKKTRQMIPAGTEASDPRPMYQKGEHMADEFIRGTL